MNTTPAQPTASNTPPVIAWAVNNLRQHNLAVRHALELGCGRGDTSLYLAEKGINVTCVDFTPAAIREIEKRAATTGVTSKIRALCLDVTEDWPISQFSCDLVIDLHSFRHIHDHDLRKNYKNNLLKSLCVHGRYLIGVGLDGDGYYGRYQKEELGILHTRQQLLQFFSPELSLSSEWALPDTERNPPPFALLLQRNPHIIG